MNHEKYAISNLKQEKLEFKAEGPTSYQLEQNKKLVRLSDQFFEDFNPF